MTRAKRKRLGHASVGLAAGLLLTLAAVGAQAQDSPPEATEEFRLTSEPLVVPIEQPNGSFNLIFQIADGWEYQYEGDRETLFIANSHDLLNRASTLNLPLAPGEAIIGIGMPNVFRGLDLPANPTPEELIATIQKSNNTTGKITTDDSFGVPAAFGDFSGEVTRIGPTRLYALDFDAGMLSIAIVPSDTAADPQVTAMLHSIWFGRSDQRVGETTDAQVIRQWASSAEGSSQYSDGGWSFAQATGEPDTLECGDTSTAWASATSTGKDYLKLHFDEPVIPTQVNIYETFSPGSIIGVDLGNSQVDAALISLRDSTDPVGNTACPGVFTVDISGVDSPVDTVVIYLNQNLGGSWNEIDAVELVGMPTG